MARKLTWVVVGFAVLMFAVAMGVHSNSELEAAEAAKTPEQRASEARARAADQKEKLLREEISSAQFTCEEAVTKSLHDPKSAEMDRPDQYPVRLESSGVYVVQVQGRARNGFNALRQLSVVCRVQHASPKADWRVLSLKEAR